MPDASRSGDEHTDRRPTLLLVVYSWDMLSAIVAIFEALAPFAGGIAVGARQEELPIGLQLLGALSPAAYATVLIIVASLLTRRQRWIQRLQVVALALAVVLQGASLAVTYTRAGIDVIPVLTTALIILFNILAILVMTERRVSAWYTEEARPPRYAVGALGFWVASYVALIVVDLIR